ncbi:DUF4166 domain-containing protein [Rhodobacteraceae bacterium B1Z28]|uniref:DUF4166 domain-containing protein n=2 Tax=Ruegeria haliotis TaxID=2747601 RepID=A0ABX2PK84_9RHOB|nr:DUF4166 domain-containing protein [Ruegeria haliotis]
MDFPPHSSMEIDNRFRDLVGQTAWAALPHRVQHRFGHCLADGASVVYQGKVVAMRMNVAGRLVAQLARLVGGPLPYDTSCLGQPAVVTVTEDRAGCGQFWVRQYGRSGRFPQVIHSSKRFTGPTGIEEYIGAGIGITLRVSTDHSGICFHSDHYFVQVCHRKLRLPSWLRPGTLTIAHKDLGDARFLFSLTLHSRLFGELIRQDALFFDR